MEEAMEEGSVLQEATTAAAADYIRPPRLEDAGLEDCALPPESIMEAFARAAISARPAIDEAEDDEDSASEAPVDVVGDGGENFVASDGFLALGGEVSDSEEKKRGDEQNEE